MEVIRTHILMGGPVIYPLLLCSSLVLALILERFTVFAFYPLSRCEQRQRQFMARAAIKPDEDTQSGGGIGRGLQAGLQELYSKREQPKSVRDQALSFWLQGERSKLMAHTRWLTLLGAIAPLLGLLGTVLGIIAMFQNVAHVTGPVTPALLAEGMWEAMVTTALGMLIAIPALVASQGFSIWGDYRIEQMAQVLNRCSLAIEMGEVNFSQSVALVKPSVRRANVDKPFPTEATRSSALQEQLA